MARTNGFGSVMLNNGLHQRFYGITKKTSNVFPWRHTGFVRPLSGFSVFATQPSQPSALSETGLRRPGKRTRKSNSPPALST